MSNPIVLAIVSAAMYGTWPLVARFAPISPAWMTLILAAATGATAIIGIPGAIVPSARFAAIIVVAGIMNGIGVLCYSKIIGMEGIELSKIIPVVMVLTPIFTVIGAWVILGDPMTAKKMAGIALAIAAIYLLA